MAIKNDNGNRIHTLPCNVDGCDGVVGEQSITGLCKKCYSSLLTWSKNKSATQRIKRAQQLKLYESRLCYLLPDDKIQLLTTRSKYAPLPVLPGKVKQYRKRSKYKVMKS